MKRSNRGCTGFPVGFRVKRRKTPGDGIGWNDGMTQADFAVGSESVEKK